MKTDAKSDWNHSFSKRDFLDIEALGRKLHTGGDPADAHLRGLLSPEANRKLAAWGSDGFCRRDAVTQLLINEFNRIISAAGLHDPKAFSGVKLRPGTEKLLKTNPQGLDLVRLNKRLLQDAYSDELLHDSCTPLGQRFRKGMKFDVYRVTRVLVTKVNTSYQIYFSTREGRQSTWAATLEDVEAEISGLADSLLSGAAPLTKDEAKLRQAKAEAYDEVLKVLANLTITGEAAVLEFIQDAAKAQALLGPHQPLLAFVQKAADIMPKPTKRELLSRCAYSYKVFQYRGQSHAKPSTESRVHHVIRFVSEIQMWQLVAEALEKQKEASDTNVVGTSEDSDPVMAEENSRTEIYADDVTALGIQIFINRLKVSAKTRRDYLTDIRNFFRYLRDNLHVIAQTPKTVADLVPLPKREAKEAAVAILWFDEIWKILLNVQDLDALFYVSLGVFSGLHTTEILRLVWEWDIKWEKGMPVQIQIATGKGKETQGPRAGRYVSIPYPLNVILALGKGRTGKVITHGAVTRFKIRPLIRQLKIAWEQSIMRHTAATFKKAWGMPLKDVADELGDREGTVKKWYLRELPKRLGRLHFTMPVDIGYFAHLPVFRRFWDGTEPLRELVLPGIDVKTFVRDTNADLPVEGLNWRVVAIVPEARWSPQRTFQTAVSPTDYHPSSGRRCRSRYKWPSDLEFQVLLYEKTQEQIARMIGCRPVTVSARAINLGFPHPDCDHWLRKKAGLPVDLPEVVMKARLMLREQQQTTGGEENSAEPRLPSQLEISEPERLLINKNQKHPAGATELNHSLTMGQRAEFVDVPKRSECSTKGQSITPPQDRNTDRSTGCHRPRHKNGTRRIARRPMGNARRERSNNEFRVKRKTRK